MNFSSARSDILKTLLKNFRLSDGNAACAVITDTHFSYVGSMCPEDRYDTVKDCRGGLLIPAFYNTHCHAAMTLFRGYGDELPLQRWLNERIFPAEDRLTGEAAYYASLLACAEMIRSGTVSFSDMYMFEDVTARAVSECGMKANLSRGIVSFDDNADFAADSRLCEALDLYRNWDGAEDGRIKIELSLHAEYTNVPGFAAYVSDVCRERGIALQLHLSETKYEHQKCIEKYGYTPTEFFLRAGAFDTRVTAAHCVWVSDDDIAVLAERGVFVSHNPASNMKLGSGIMPYTNMKRAGVRLSFGTDGAASNNAQSILREMQLAALIHKGTDCDPTAATAADMLYMATRGGALAQGRADCAVIEPGARADVVLIDCDAVNMQPANDVLSAIMYNADVSNVVMTMCDGRILYENGEYKSIDTERVKFNFRSAVSQILQGIH